MKFLPHFVWEHLNPVLLALKKTVYQAHFKNRNMAPLKPEKRVLILAHSAGVGNAVEATPLVQAIRTLWPTCHLSFFPPAGDLFSGWCVPDRIIKSLQEIKGEKFDDVFVSYLFEDTRPLKTICTYGKIHKPKIKFNKWLFKHERSYYLDMAKRCGFQGDVPPAFVAANRPNILPPDSSLRFCIVPCGKNESKWRYKKWPFYPELIQLLHAAYPEAQFCIVGTESDDIDLSQVTNTEIIDMRGQHTLSETAWIMQHSNFVIGNDSGPMHIADAVQAKGFVIFGPTCIIKNGPRNKIVPLASNVECRPCQYSEMREKCSHGQCMKDITPEVILEKINRIHSNHQPPV